MPRGLWNVTSGSLSALPSSGTTDVAPLGLEVEFINLVIPSDKGPDKVTLSVANLLKGIGDTEDAAKTPPVHLGDGLPPIPTKIAARLLKGQVHVHICRDGRPVARSLICPERR